MSKALKGDIILFIIFLVFAVSTIYGIFCLVSDIRHKKSCAGSIELLAPAAIGALVLAAAHWYIG